VAKKTNEKNGGKNADKNKILCIKAQQLRNQMNSSFMLLI